VAVTRHDLGFAGAHAHRIRTALVGAMRLFVQKGGDRPRVSKCGSFVPFEAPDLFPSSQPRRTPTDWPSLVDAHNPAESHRKSTDKLAHLE